MKFCIVSNIFPPHVRGGYELGCQAIAEELVASGHTVEIITSYVSGRLAKTEAPTSTLLVHRLFDPVFEYEDIFNDLSARNDIWFQRRLQAFGGVIASNAIALSHFLAAQKPDAVWVFNPLGLGPIGILEAAQTCGARCIIHLMDHIDGVIAGHQARSRYPYYEGRWRRLKREVTAISCSRKTLIANSVLGSYRSHRIIYNGVDFPSISPPLPQRVPGPTRFVYFGQVEKAKGLSSLVAAAKCLRDRSPRRAFTIDVIGRGNERYRAELQSLIDEVGLTADVRLLGFMPKPQIMTALAQYDAAVMLLGGDEPFAYAPVEAAAAGLSVIQTTASGSAECLPSDYQLGVNNREDACEVADRMQWCIDNLADLPGIGSALREHLRRHYDFKSVIMPAYMNVIESARPASGNFSVAGLIAADMTARSYEGE